MERRGGHTHAQRGEKRKGGLRRSTGPGGCYNGGSDNGSMAERKKNFGVKRLFHAKEYRPNTKRE